MCFYPFIQLSPWNFSSLGTGKQLQASTELPSFTGRNLTFVLKWTSETCAVLAAELSNWVSVTKRLSLQTYHLPDQTISWSGECCGWNWRKKGGRFLSLQLLLRSPMMHTPTPRILTKDLHGMNLIVSLDLSPFGLLILPGSFERKRLCKLS